MTTPLDAALTYAAAGWPVFPCRPDKKPYTTHGHNDASTDPAKIDAWWRRWPQAQVAVNCGAARLVVIDLDLEPSEKKDGVATFARLAEQHDGHHECALIASTPRGGRHYFYLATSHVTTCSDVLPGSGIDVRAVGGYVVLPSPASPAREWIIGDPCAPLLPGCTADLCPMPPWVLELVTARRAAPSSPDAPSGLPEAAPIDDRQAAAIRAALAHIDNAPRDNWIRVGMALKSTGAREQAYDLWVEWSRHGAGGSKFDAKDQRYQWDRLAELRWDGSEVTIATLFHLAKEGGYVARMEEELVCEVPAATRLPAPKIPETPEDTAAASAQIPAHLLQGDDLLMRMARWIDSTAPQEQPAFALAASLCALGAILGRRVQSPTGLRTNIYALACAGTCDGKGWAAKCVTRIMVAANVTERLGPSEFKSGSGVRALLLDYPSVVACIDEFGLYLGSTLDPAAPAYLRDIVTKLMVLFSVSDSVHQPDAYADRRANPPQPLYEPNLCVYGMTTPSTLFGSLSSGSISSGLLGRVLLFQGTSTPPRRFDGVGAPPDPALVQTIRDLDRATRPPEGTIEHMGGFARTLPLTPEADAWVRELYATNDARMARIRLRGSTLGDIWGRHVEHAIKLALIRTVTADPSATTIGLPALRWGEALAAWCATSLQRSAGDLVADSPRQALAQRMLRAIRDAGEAGITGTQLYRSSQHLSRTERKDILATLLESELIEMAERPAAAGQPGRPVTVYRVAR